MVFRLVHMYLLAYTHTHIHTYDLTLLCMSYPCDSGESRDVKMLHSVVNKRAVFKSDSPEEVTVTVTVTVTVNLFKCPKNKRPRGLPSDIRLLQLHLELPYMQNVLAHVVIDDTDTCV